MSDGRAGDRPTAARATRRTIPAPARAVLFERPPPPPDAPSFSPDRYIFPLIGVVLGLAGLVYFMVGDGQQTMFMVISAPVMVMSVVSLIYSYVAERKGYERTRGKREQAFGAYLSERRRELELLTEEHRRASLDANPPLEECVARVERRSPRVWERARSDPDFLSVRIGTREEPPSFEITLPPPASFAAGVADPFDAAARELIARYRTVSGAAAVLPLAKLPVVGVTGPDHKIDALLQALLIHAATHHGPSDARMALILPPQDVDRWRGVRWLPHLWLDDTLRAIGSTADGGDRVLDRVAAHINAPRSASVDDFCVLLVVADSTWLKDEHGRRLRKLLQSVRGDASTVRVRVILAAPHPDVLHGWCDAIVEVGDAASRVQLPQAPDATWKFVPDAADPATLEYVARALAPLRQGAGGDAAVPRVATLLETLGVRTVEELNIAERWRGSKPFESTAAPIGIAGGGRTIVLDVHQRVDGPNGLLAGTVGSGKSELLLALVAGIAVNHRPAEVNLAILDFKGGATSNQLAPLPHVVSTLTDLEMRDVPRALLSLEAELERRKRLFRQASETLGRSVDDLDQYMPLARQGRLPPIPYLIVVVDEFTVLKKSNPDDMTRFENIAMQGRSLGVRMLLAAQKPAGEISAQVAANTNFRLCLRVASPGDSTEMIGRPDAAFLGRGEKGRGFFRVGNDEVFELFQSAWSRAPYEAAQVAADAISEMAEVLLDGTRRPLGTSERPTVARQSKEDSPNQLQVVIDAVRREAEGLAPQRPIWMPPLPALVRLGEVRTEPEGWDGAAWTHARPSALRPVVGLLDDPAAQQQVPLRLDLTADYHLGVLGAPGSGKTTFLQTLVYSLALDHHPDDLHVYMFAFGGGGLAVFEDLPHVGAIVEGDEPERVKRLVRTLTGLLQARQRQRTIHPDIVVVMDNYDAFAKMYEDFTDAITTLAREGGGVGIHLVLGSSSTPRLLDHIKTRVALPMVDRGGYSSVLDVTPRDMPDMRPGRAFLSGRPPMQFHTAVVWGDAPVDMTQVLDTATAMAAAVPRTADEIGLLPDVVALSEVLPQLEGWSQESPAAPVPLAVDADTLHIVSVSLDEGPHFLISGTRGSGVTSFLRTWLVALAESFPPARLRLVLSGAELAVLRELPHARLASTAEELNAALDEMENAAGSADAPHCVIAIASAAEFQRVMGSEAAERLEQVMRLNVPKFHMVLGAALQDLQTLRNESIGAIARTLDAGFILGTRDPSHLEVLNLSLPYGPRGQSTELPSGLGYYARRGSGRQVRVASAAAGGDSVAGWEHRIRVKSGVRGQIPTGETVEDPARA